MGSVSVNLDSSQFDGVAGPPQAPDWLQAAWAWLTGGSVTAQEISNPNSVYTPPPAPAAPQPPANWDTTPAPGAVDQVIAANSAANQAQNQQFFSDLGTTLDQQAAGNAWSLPQLSSNTAWLLLAGGVIVALLLLRSNR